MNKSPFLVAPIALALSLSMPLPARASNTSTPILTSTFNVQEDANAYSVRLGVPETTDVNVRLAGSTLVLESAPPANGIRYEQRITLSKAQANAALGIKRDGAELVIAVPKGDPAAAVAAPQLGSTGNPSFDSLRDQVLSQAANMLREMGNEDATPPTGTADPKGPQDLFGALLGGIAPQLQSRMGTSGFQLDDRGDAYVLTSTLPEEQARNVSVNVDNERAITITSKHEKKSASGGATAFSAGSSTQSMTLPGPVRGEEMKMDYRNGKLEIVLPKK